MNIGLSTRKLAWLPLLVALVASLCVTGAASAAAAPFRVLSPGPDALVTGKRIVVRAKVGHGVSRVRVRIAGHELKTRPGGHGTRVATAPLRRLPGGRVTLAMEGRRGGHEVSSYGTVVLGRHSPSLLTEVSLPRHAAGTTSLRLRVGGRVSDFRLSVDGGRAKLLHLPRRGRPVSLPLSADDGLHRGRNRVVVLAWRAKTGHWDRAARTVTMAPGVPLAAAGNDLRTTAGARLRLDGTDSRPARRGEHLHYDWRIVSQPSSPTDQAPGRILDPHASRPRLVTHRAGTYKVALSLGGAGRHQAAPASARASAVGSGPTPSNFDVATIEASVSVMPYGAELITRPAEGGAYWETRVEGVPIDPDGHWFAAVPKSSTQLIVLNRETLAEEESQTAEGAEGCAEMAEQAQKVSVEDLAILTSAPGNCEGARGAGFTAVISGGVTLGENVGNEIGAGAPGAIEGYLRRVHTSLAPGNFTFVFTQAMEFDTFVQPEETGPVSTQIGAETFPDELEEGKKGIVITALTPALKRIAGSSSTFPLRAGEETAALAAVTHRLETITAGDHDGVLLLQTLGGPQPNSEDAATWEALGAVLEAFGGTPTVWDGLDGTGNYSLVGAVLGKEETGPRRSVSTLESSEPLEGQTIRGGKAKKWLGTARGVLGLGDEAHPVVRVGSSLPPYYEEGELINPGSFLALAEAEPVPFPGVDPGNAEYEEALTEISEDIGPENTVTGKPKGLGSPHGSTLNECFQPTRWDVRAAFCNVNNNAKWSEYKEQVKNFPCPESDAHYTVEVCEEMKTALASEISDVVPVHGLIETLQKPFHGSEAAAVNAFQNASTAIENEKTVKPITPMSGTPQSLFDGATTILQDTDFGVPGVSQIFGLIEAAVNIGLEASETEDHEPAGSPYLIKEKEKFGTESANRLGDAGDGIAALEELILTDPTKMSEVAAGTANRWGATAGTLIGAEAQIKRGSETWLWEALMPAAYGQIQVTPKEPSMTSENRMEVLHGLRCEIQNPNPTEVEKWLPFGHVPENDVFLPPGFGGDTAWMIGNFGAKEGVFPDEALLTRLFEKAGSNEKAVGLYPAPFFTWDFATGRRTMTSVLAEKGLGDPSRCQGT